jgi:c-di-GMP-binding flagellar brake protein YcgR
MTMWLETHPLSKAPSAKRPSRRYPRVVFSVPITLRHLTASGVRTSPGMSLDISKGGMGALVQGQLQVGETVAIDLPVAERMLSTVAIVRHTSNVSSGFEFIGLSPEEQSQILSIAGHS